MPTDTDWQTDILAEVGDPNGTLTPLIATIWDLFADKALIRSDLQVLYTKRACLDRRLAEEYASTDVGISGEITDKESQRFAHMQQMRADCQLEIERIERIIHASRTPALGALTTLVPTSPPSTLGPDANDDLYLGTPYGYDPGDSPVP